MSERKVQCVKLGAEAPGLETPPFAGELGQQIFDRVSKQVWLSWADDVMIKVINEYRLNLADPQHYEVLLDQMRAFLNLDSNAAPVDLENPERGR